jgi:hypothetical protein
MCSSPRGHGSKGVLGGSQLSSAQPRSTSAVVVRCIACDHPGLESKRDARPTALMPSQADDVGPAGWVAAAPETRRRSTWHRVRVRVYLPTTLSDLAAATSDVVAPPGAHACAVTPALREWYIEGDIDELEYAALTRAAHASLRLLSASGRGDRRVVLAIDVPDHEVAANADELDREPAAVIVTSPIMFNHVVSAHVDDPEAAPEVRAAAKLVAAADAGDPDAVFAVEALDDHDLQWFAVQEIRFLLS